VNKRLLTLLVVLWAALCMAPFGARRLPPSNLIPQVTGASSVVSTGGTLSIIGTGFESGAKAWVCLTVSANGTCPAGTSIVWLTITFQSSTSLSAVLPSGTYPVSEPNFFPLTVINPSGMATTSSQFMINNVATPSSILAGNCLLWVTGSSYSSGTWTDLCTYGQSLTFSANPTVNSGDAQFNGQTSLTFDGATVKASKAGFSLESGNGLWCMAVSRMTTFATADTVWTYGTEALARYNTTTVLSTFGDALGQSAAYTPGFTLTNQTIGWYGYDVFGSPDYTIGILQGLGPPESTSSPASWSIPSSATFIVGSQTTGGSNFFNGKLAELVCANEYPGATLIGEIYNYENAKYALDAQPSINNITAVQPTGGQPVRFGGSNLSQGGTAAAASFGGSLGSTTCRKSASSGMMCVAVEGTLASGTYSGMSNGTVTNADGQAFTQGNGIIVTPFDDPWAILGSTLVSWGSAGAVTCPGGSCTNGSNVSGAVDLSALGNTWTQGTTANQPTLVSSDAHFGGQPSLAFTGSGSSGEFLQVATANIGTGWWSSAVFFMSAVYVTGVESGSAGAVFTLVSGDFDCRLTTAGDPTVFLMTSSESVASNKFGVAGTLYCYATNIGTGSGTNTIGVNWQNGTEVNGSFTTGANLSGAINFAVGARTDGTIYIIGNIAEWFVANAVPNSTKLTALQGYFHTKYGL
jgi:hypothetical protein